MSRSKHGKYRFQDFEVDLAQRSFRREGNTVTVGPRTFDLLAFLILNPQRVVAKEELMEALWPNSQVEESNLSQHIFLLRKALDGILSGDRLILTVPGRGYQFTSPVIEVHESEDAEPDEQPDQQSDRQPDQQSDEPPVLRTFDSSARVSIEEVAEPSDLGEQSDSQDHAVGFFAGFRHPGPWQVLLVTATLAILGFGGLFAWRWIHRVHAQSLRIVIADFENTTGEPQFDLALKTALAIDLRQSPFLDIASRAKVSQALREMKQPGDRPITPDAAREVCRRINDQAFLTPSIRRLSSKYMITLEGFDCAGGHSLAASRGIADTPDGVVAILDRVAADLRKQLGEPSQSVDRSSKPLFAGRAASFEALRSFSDALHLGLQGKTQDSVTLFQHAVEIDPQFAIAFADLGVTYANLGESDLAKESLTRAYELRDTVDEPDRLFIISSYNELVSGDIQASIRNAKSWSEEYPSNPAPLVDLADLESQIGKPALAMDPAKRALELNPDDASAYEVTARVQLRLGQFDQAAATCQAAIQHHVDGGAVHAILLQLAFLRLDQAGIDAQISWAKGLPDEPYMQLQQGLMDFALGKARAAQAVFESVVEDYRKEGQNDRADRIQGGMPRIEAELGLTDLARTQLGRMADIKGSTDIPVAWAHVGETSRAEALLKTELDSHLTTTLWQDVFGPEIKAAIAMNQQRPEEAIDDLKPALPYEMHSFDVPAMRGRAYLLAKQPDLAEAEFHKVLDHPGVEPLSHNYPLAQLGLARSLAAQGKTVEAGFAYKIVLQIWKDADSDLPRLREAKAEYARLGNELVKPRPAAPAPVARKPSASRR